MLHGRVKESLTEKQRSDQKTKLSKYQTLLNLALFIGNTSPITSPNPLLIPENSKKIINPLVHIAILSKLSTINPDVPTIWNNRRKLLQFTTKTLPAPAQLGIYLKDLEFTLGLPHQKSYPLFWHMEWLISTTCLSTSPQAATMIVKRCSQLIWKDCRNFHAWDLLRCVNRIFKVSPHHQLEWANFMISRNLKNGSAWHSRYICLLNLKQLDLIHREKLVIQHALAVIPDNESVLMHQKRITHLDTLFSLQKPDQNDKPTPSS